MPSIWNTPQMFGGYRFNPRGNEFGNWVSQLPAITRESYGLGSTGESPDQKSAVFGAMYNWLGSQGMPAVLRNAFLRNQQGFLSNFNDWQVSNPTGRFGNFLGLLDWPASWNALSPFEAGRNNQYNRVRFSGG